MIQKSGTKATQASANSGGNKKAQPAGSLTRRRARFFSTSGGGTSSLWDFYGNVVFAVERRGKNHEGNARRPGGIDIIVDGAARNVNNVSCRQFNSFIIHH